MAMRVEELFLYLFLQCKRLEEKLEGLKSNQDSVSPEDRKRASQ